LFFCFFSYLFKLFFITIYVEKAKNMILKVCFITSLVVFGHFVLSTDNLSRIKSGKCNSSLKTIKPNFKCFARSYSRRVSAFSLDFYVTRPIYKAWVKTVDKSNITKFYQKHFRSKLNSNMAVESRLITTRSLIQLSIFVNFLTERKTIQS
jgi:translation initiation factor 2 beta subunit (eIF-2beta)/eIF-5